VSLNSLVGVIGFALKFGKEFCLHFSIEGLSFGDLGSKVIRHNDGVFGNNGCNGFDLLLSVQFFFQFLEELLCFLDESRPSLLDVVLGFVDFDSDILSNSGGFDGSSSVLLGPFVLEEAGDFLAMLVEVLGLVPEGSGLVEGSLGSVLLGVVVSGSLVASGGLVVSGRLVASGGLVVSGGLVMLRSLLVESEASVVETVLGSVQE